MGKIRRCGRRCHEAKGKRCRCWCGGAFHGVAGAQNRAALGEGVTDLLEEHGFKEGETRYHEQLRLPVEV